MPFSRHDNRVVELEELPKKTKLFFEHIVGNWDGEFYVKVNDDVHVNISEYQWDELLFCDTIFIFQLKICMYLATLFLC